MHFSTNFGFGAERGVKYKGECKVETTWEHLPVAPETNPHVGHHPSLGKNDISKIQRFSPGGPDRPPPGEDSNMVEIPSWGDWGSGLVPQLFVVS